MNTAQIIIAACAGASAYTLEGGYAVGPLNAGRTLFEPGKCTDIKRNKAGRCTHAEYVYLDGSALRFTWSPARGSLLKEMQS